MEALQSAAAASPLSVGSHSSAALDGDPPIPAYLPPTGVRSAGASSKSLRMTLDLGRLHSSPPASLGSPRSKVGLLWGYLTCGCAARLHPGGFVLPCAPAGAEASRLGRLGAAGVQAGMLFGWHLGRLTST